MCFGVLVVVEPSYYVLWGSGGHAKVLAGAITKLGGRVLAVFDNDPQAQPVLPGVPLYIGLSGWRSWLASHDNGTPVAGLAAIGGARGAARLEAHALFRDAGLRLGPFCHPDSSVCVTAVLGQGVQILARAVVAADANLGEACIVNHAASVDHECELSTGVHIAPGATLCGLVSVGANSMIGAGAVILPRVQIGARCIVGAGAVVLHNVLDDEIVAGNPARAIRMRGVGE